jgi:hypothetical protein
MFLCHKCSGLLVHGKSEDISGLRGCSCMSGYFRGFEPDLTREQAIDAQIEGTVKRIELYEQQGRSKQYIDPEMEKLDQLVRLKDKGKEN